MADPALPVDRVFDEPEPYRMHVSQASYYQLLLVADN